MIKHSAFLFLCWEFSEKDCYLGVVKVSQNTYYNLKRDFEFFAKEYGCSFHELHDPRLEYPEEIEW